MEMKWSGSCLFKRLIGIYLLAIHLNKSLRRLEICEVDAFEIWWWFELMEWRKKEIFW